MSIKGSPSPGISDRGFTCCSRFFSMMEHLQDFSISHQSAHINTLTSQTGRWLTVFFFFFIGRQLQLSDDGSLMRWSPRQCELSTGVSINPQVRITSQHISRIARQLRLRRARAAVSSLMEASAGGSQTDGAESSSPAEPSSVTFWPAPVQTLN